jgi:hypothetical protein
MVDDETIATENAPRVTLGAIIASALVAAVVAFLLRRALRSDQEETLTQKVMADLERADLRQRAAAATGDFVRSSLAPELKPVLLNVLKDVRDYVDRGFQRAERSIKEL